MATKQKEIYFAFCLSVSLHLGLCGMAILIEDFFLSPPTISIWNTASFLQIPLEQYDSFLKLGAPITTKSKVSYDDANLKGTDFLKNTGIASKDELSKPTKIDRYEQLLSTYFAEILSDLSFESINVWIFIKMKINRNGKIIGFSFDSNLPVQEIIKTSIVKKIEGIDTVYPPPLSEEQAFGYYIVPLLLSTD